MRGLNKQEYDGVHTAANSGPTKGELSRHPNRIEQIANRRHEYVAFQNAFKKNNPAIRMSLN